MQDYWLDGEEAADDDPAFQYGVTHEIRFCFARVAHACESAFGRFEGSGELNSNFF
jgi:hypothetical protein